MPISKVAFKPGINRETTQYANSGGWWDADKIRFRSGYPETIGGWSLASSFQAKGVCRSLHEWANNQGYGHLGMGTNSKFYILVNDTFYDVTPQRAAVVLPVDPFSTTSDPTTLTVHFPYSGCNVGDFVTFTGALTGVGPYSASDLNATFNVASIPDLTHLVLVGTKTASTPGLTGGGSAVMATADIPIGPVDASLAVGFGIGGYGLGPYGTARPADAGASTLSPIIIQPRIWSQDNFGEDLVIAPRGGQIYLWDTVVDGVSGRATLLSSYPLARDVPVQVTEVFVSLVDENLVALGCNPFGSVEFDPLYVRWSDQMNPYLWTPLATNNAGGQRLSSGSEIIGHIQTASETLIWTDVTMYSMQFLGGTFTYGFNTIANGVSMIGPNAASTNGSIVVWMDKGAFYVYNGGVQELPCTLKEYVFSNLNYLQAWKINCFHHREFSEIWWQYPSADSLEVDSYVIWNYKDNNWSKGTLDRTAWTYSGRLQTPLATDPNGFLYLQETGSDANGTPMQPFIESADLDANGGDSYLFLSRIIPDVDFRGASKYQSVRLDVLKRDSSGEDKVLERTLEVVPTTRYIDTRARGRRLSVKFSSNTLGTAWKLGATEINVAPNGTR